MAPNHDLKGLKKFAERDEWQACFAAVMDEHLSFILEGFNAGFYEILGEHVADFYCWNL